MNANRSAVAVIESLEQRVVLSGHAVSFAMGVDPEIGGLTAAILDTDYSDDFQLSNQSFLLAADGGPVSTPEGITAASLNLLDTGGFTVNTIPGELPWDHEVGNRFLRQDNMNVGSFIGYDDGYDDWRFDLIVDAPETAPLSDLNGTWSITLFRFTPGAASGEALSGTVSIANGSAVFLATSAQGQPPLATSVQVTNDLGNGLFEATGGYHFAVNHDASTLLFGDFDSADGSLLIGVGVKPTTGTTQADLAGVYRVGTALPQSLTDLSNDLNPVEALVFSLDPNGQYIAYDAEAFDAGNLEVVISGAWGFDGTSITVPTASATLTLLVGDDGSTLLPTLATVDLLGQSYNTFGHATRVPDELFDPGLPGGLELGLGVLDTRSDPAEPVVYERRDDNFWTIVNLIAETASDLDPATVNSIATFTDPVDNRFHAAVNSDTGLRLYTRSPQGLWSERDLTAEIVGAATISSSLTVFNSLEAETGELSHIAGLDANGDLVIYRQSTTAVGGWEFVNIAETELRPNGMEMPALAGDIISYVTGWNGLNVAGLDADGNIHSVWWAPGVSNWSTSNLSEINGAAPIAGGLTAYLTSWLGINIAGVDADGNILVTWWVPSFGGDWQNTNLTDFASGPAVQPGSISSWVASWDGLNLGALDENGEVVIYFWSPESEASGDGWLVADMTAALPAEQPRPAGDLSSTVADGDQFNLFGTSDDGELIRLHWMPGDTEWTIENLTELATANV